MKPFGLSLIASVLVFSSLGCTSHEIRALTPEPTDSYLTKQTIAGIIVAAQSLATKEKSEAAFSADLSEQGYAPIPVVVENRSTDNILLQRDGIELTDSRGNVQKPVSATVMVEKFEHNKMAYALLGFGIFSYMSAEEANKKMKEDWSSKELPVEKVLLPSRKVHGVLYFYLGEGLVTLPNATLHIPFQNMRSNEHYSADLRVPSR